MAKIPQAVIEKCGKVAGLGQPRRGKVRDVYQIPSRAIDEPRLAVVATDRTSIFDFVLGAVVPSKGSVLNALNIFWRTQIFGDVCDHDLLYYGPTTGVYLPAGIEMTPDLAARITVVKKRQVAPVECIVRWNLTGSGLKDYQKTGQVSGHKLPKGLSNGNELPFPIFTPSTKAEEGHDENIDFRGVAQKWGFDLERLSLALFQMGRRFARRRGLILADTKFEFSLDPLCLLDEVLTPDSSRFWDEQAWTKAQAEGNLPPSLDKQYVREWGKKVGIDKRDPAKPEDVAWVHEQEVPAEVLAQTTQLYRYIFWRLVGTKLEIFQRQHMGILVEPPRVNVDVVLGSRSDLEAVIPALRILEDNNVDTQVHVVSCHRNPDDLRAYAFYVVRETASRSVDVVIAAAGKAAQLPGVLKSWLDWFGRHDIPVIGVGLGDLAKDSGRAAALSIEQLPGTPVELDENGRAYFGVNGMIAAAAAARNHEFLPRKNAAKKAEFNINVDLGSGRDE